MSDVQRKKWFLFMTCDKRYSPAHQLRFEAHMLSVLADSFGEAQDLAKNMALVQGRKVVFKKDIYGDHRSYHAEKSSDKPFHMEVEEGASGLAFAEAGCQLGMQIAVALHAVEASVVSALADDD